MPQMGYNAQMIREITITPVLNGFVCKVGCQKVVFECIEDMVENIADYYRNPEKVEKEFLAQAVNKMDDGPGPVCCGTAEADVAVHSNRGLDSICESVAEARNPTPLREVRTTRG